MNIGLTSFRAVTSANSVWQPEPPRNILSSFSVDFFERNGLEEEVGIEGRYISEIWLRNLLSIALFTAVHKQIEDVFLIWQKDTRTEA